MNFKAVDYNEVMMGYKKTKLMRFLEDFQKANIPMAEITDWGEEYSATSSLSSSISNSIKNFKMSNLECKTIDKKVYLINKLLAEKED